jgi:hypothetical protein
MRKSKSGMPIGHGVSLIPGDAGAGKSTPDNVAENERKLRGDPRRSGRTQTAKKSLVVVEVRTPVPQTDSGRLG